MTFDFNGSHLTYYIFIYFYIHVQDLGILGTSLDPIDSPSCLSPAIAGLGEDQKIREGLLKDQARADELWRGFLCHSARLSDASEGPRVNHPSAKLR